MCCFPNNLSKIWLTTPQLVVHLIPLCKIFSGSSHRDSQDRPRVNFSKLILAKFEVRQTFLNYRKDTELLYHSFMYSLVSLLSGSQKIKFPGISPKSPQKEAFIILIERPAEISLPVFIDITRKGVHNHPSTPLFSLPKPHSSPERSVIQVST